MFRRKSKPISRKRPNAARRMCRITWSRAFDLPHFKAHAVFSFSSTDHNTPTNEAPWAFFKTVALWSRSSRFFSVAILRGQIVHLTVVRLDLATRALKIPILLIAINDLSPAPQTRSPALPPALLHFSYFWELSRHQGITTVAYHSWSYTILYHPTDISRQALLFALAPLKTCELEYCATKSS